MRRRLSAELADLARSKGLEAPEVVAALRDLESQKALTAYRKGGTPDSERLALYIAVQRTLMEAMWRINPEAGFLVDSLRTQRRAHGPEYCWGAGLQVLDLTAADRSRPPPIGPPGRARRLVQTFGNHADVGAMAAPRNSEEGKSVNYDLSLGMTRYQRHLGSPRQQFGIKLWQTCERFTNLEATALRRGRICNHGSSRTMIKRR